MQWAWMRTEFDTGTLVGSREAGHQSDPSQHLGSGLSLS